MRSFPHGQCLHVQQDQLEIPWLAASLLKLPFELCPLGLKTSVDKNWSYPVSVDSSELVAEATPQFFSSHAIGHS